MKISSLKIFHGFARIVCVGISFAGLIGCTLHDEQEIASVRARGVSAEIVRKLQTEEILTPGDIVALKRRGIKEEIIIEHIDEVGVDYVLNKKDIRNLKAAGASTELMEELTNASDDFRGEHEPHRTVVYLPLLNDPYYYSDPVYYDRSYYHRGYYVHGNRNRCNDGQRFYPHQPWKHW